MDNDDKTVDPAIQRVEDIARRVRAQAFERFAFPWRFEHYPLTDLADPPGDTGLVDAISELEGRYRDALEADGQVEEDAAPRLSARSARRFDSVWLDE